MLQNNKTQGLRVSPKVQRLQRFGRPNSAGSIRVLQNRRIQGCAQRSNQGSKVTTVWPTSCCSEHKSMLHKRCCCEDTRCEGTCVLCRTEQSTVAPTDQGLQTFGRPSAAGNIHTCVAESADSKLHQGPRDTRVWQINCNCRSIEGCTGIKGYEGLADQPAAAASIHMCIAEKSGLHENCTEGSRVARVRPATRRERTHVCCKQYQTRAAPTGRHVPKGLVDHVLL